MLKTVLCEILEIEHPILQGGMAWVSRAELVFAVEKAGAFGFLTSAIFSPEDLRKEIRRLVEMGGRNFGVNIYLLHPFVEQQIRVCIEEGVKAISTGAGTPGKYIKELKERGIKVFPVISSVSLAKRLEKQGATGVIAEGMESGGHIGEVTTLCLVPQIVDAVSIPVIAAGGIADGRGLVAALSLGAVGVQMGTRFIASQEAPVHNSYKQEIINAMERDTVVTGISTGHPMRVIKNKLAMEFLKREKEGATREEIESLGIGSLRKAVEGDVEWGSLMAGQISGLIKDVKPVKDIIEDIINEAEETIERLKGLKK